MFLIAMMVPAVMQAQVKNATIVTTTATACDTFAWNVSGMVYTAGGVYTYVKHDTAFVLDLTLGHAVDTVFTTPIHAGCQYVWAGDTIKTSQTLTKTFTTAQGCDSNVTKTFTIGTVQYSIVYDTACEILQWHGMTLTSDTTVSVDTVTDGCDNNITLHLKVNTPRQINRYVRDTACDKYAFSFISGARNYVATESMDTTTNTFSQSSTAMRNVFHPRTKAKCFDSTYHLSIVINHSNYSHISLVSCGPTQYTVGDSTYVYAYSILDTIARVGKNVAKCDSNIIMNVTVKSTPTVTVSGDLNVAPGSSATLAASSDQSNVTWKWSTGETSDTIVVNNINANTDISLTGTNTTTQCAGISNITILCNVGIDEAEMGHLNVYPNPVRAVVNIEADEAIQHISIYNGLGQRVFAGDNMGSKSSVDVSALPNGTYVMRLTAQDGTVAVRTMIISR